jgi:hypothetical protein
MNELGGEHDMQYALLIYRREDVRQGATEEEEAQINRDYWALRAVPGVTTGAGLQPTETATTVRSGDGQLLVTDGPFADTKEVLAGFYVVEADDLDRATEIAGMIPAVRFGGAIEIRPMVEPR